MKNLENESANLKQNLKPSRNYYKTKPQIEEEKKQIAIRICEVVSTYYGVKYGQLLGPSRIDKITQARHMAMYLVREKTQLSPEKIAQIFNRDRTTYLYSFNKIDGLIRSKYRDDVKQDYFNINIQI